MSGQYIVINGEGTTWDEAQRDLKLKVNDAMTEGWIPQGGLVYLGQRTAHGYTYRMFAQAMILPSEPIAK